MEANRQAKAYFGAIRLELGDAAIEAMPDAERKQLTDLSLEIETVVRDAIAENSLSPQGTEAAIRKNLLPKLFGLIGLEHAKAVVEQIVQITRTERSRG